jgi:hypothetical protein
MDVTSNSIPTQDNDDDDDVYYANVQGKKAKGGVGYAGDQREDVSTSHYTLRNILIPLRIPGNSKLKLFNVARMKK